MDQITAIRNSLTAYVCGLVGLLPLIGFPVAIYAVVFYWRVRKGFRGEWNPASHYLGWAATLGFIGVLNSTLLIFVIGLALVDALI